MDSPPYLYYHHYDPTIINTHTLLKPQAYQQPTYFNTPPSQLSQYITPPSIPYINTHISPPHTYPNFIANNSPHNLPHHINSVIQELHCSQRVCIQAISNLASDISTLNKSLTPPSLTYNNSTTSLTPFLYQQSPLTPSNISPPNFTYQQPIITPTTVTTHNFQHNQDPFPSPEPTTLTHHPNPPYNSNHVTIHFDPVSHVVGEQHIFVAKDFNDEALSELVLDFTTTLSTPKTDERSRDNNITVKGQEEGTHRLPPPIPPSPCDSDCVESLSRQASIGVHMSSAPAKQCLITTIRPSPEKTVASTAVVAAPLPQHFFIFDFGGDARRVRSLAANFGNRVCVFDPGGDKHNFCSPALILINNHGTQSPLQVPWDRGKVGVSKSLFSDKRVFINCLISFPPAAVSFLAKGAASGWPWVPWSSMKMTASVTTTYAKHVREEDTPRVNWKLKSLKFFNDLMGSSYLAQGAFSYLARDAKKNWSFEQEFGNKSTQHTLNFIWFLIKF